MKDGRIHSYLDLARAISDDVKKSGLGKRQDFEAEIDIVGKANTFDLLVTDPELKKATESLFKSGHYSDAILKGFKYLNNYVKRKSGLKSKDGADLMRAAFSAQNPKLKLNSLASASEQDEQKGFMDIYAGCMTGIRNPRAHEHDIVDEARTALELLGWCNHLLVRARSAKRSRTKRSK